MTHFWHVIVSTSRRKKIKIKQTCCCCLRRPIIARSLVIRRFGSRNGRVSNYTDDEIPYSALRSFRFVSLEAFFFSSLLRVHFRRRSSFGKRNFQTIGHLTNTKRIFSAISKFRSLTHYFFRLRHFSFDALELHSWSVFLAGTRKKKVRRSQKGKQEISKIRLAYN